MNANAWLPIDTEAVNKFSERFAAASACAATVVKALEDVGKALRFSFSGFDSFSFADVMRKPWKLRRSAQIRKARRRMQRKWYE